MVPASGTGQTKHGFEVKPCLGNIVGPEQDPSEDDHRHGVDITPSRTVFADSENAFGEQEKEIKQTPAEEGPVCPVPESGEKPDDQQIEDHSRERVHTAAAEGDVNIIPEPGGKGYMPSPPEVGDAVGNVWEIEVFREMEPEHFSQTDRHV